MTDTDDSIEYFPERRGTSSSAIALELLMAPLLVAALVGSVAPRFAWPGAIIVAGLLWFGRHRQRAKAHAVLRVEGTRLRVTNAHAKVVVDVRLEDLINVSLDTLTIQRVEESMQSGHPDLRFAYSTVSPEIDVSRIEIKTINGSYFLTEDRVSNMDATEWLQRIRRFLHKKGWVPHV